MDRTKMAMLTAYRAALCIEHDDDPPKHHIDASCEQGGRDQQEDGLDDIRAECVIWGFATSNQKWDEEPRLSFDHLPPERASE
ncbi:hypothetical protein KC340_g24 [Hortaea werneckii]|nr:hypothetical protein KC340_g24 [Hortaea werneckii]